MPSFVHPALLGPMFATLVAAVALPALIHLINLLRHRRVHWAAMEFLLASHQQNRSWVRIKELLLLALRMAAMAVLVLMIAEPLLGARLGGLFGDRQTHHILLLDDSFSMSDHWADTTAFDEAKKLIHRLATQAAERAQSQSFTLLRLSQAGRVGRQVQPDLLQEPVNREGFVKHADEVLAKLAVSQLAVGPAAGLKAVEQLLGDSAGDRRVVYLISDFRRRDWNEPTELRAQLQLLEKSDVELHLVNCVDRQRPNLAVVALEPSPGIQAAAVPFFMNVSVHNFGSVAARDVAVQLDEDGHGRPAVTLSRIPPGQTATERFLVNFPSAGEHRVTARLEGDAVAVDNRRDSVLVLPAEVPILLVDGDSPAVEARFLEVACAPGGAVRTGLRPQLETPRYLNLKAPDEFAAVNLMNLQTLDRSAVEALERFVRGGGGLAMFLSDRTPAAWVNEQLYRGGEGFFPVPLKGPADLPADRLEGAPDVSVEDHLAFRVYNDARNPFLDAIAVRRYFAVTEGWTPPPQSTVRVIARLRNGAPLVVERTFGQGRVVVFLTTAGPTWNNWARNPSFAVMVLDLEAFLARRTAGDAGRLVGTPIEVRLDPSKYLSGVRFVAPNEAASVTVDAVPAADGMVQATYADTERSGIYQAQLTRSDQSVEVRSFALNVDPGEGDLAIVPREELATRLAGVNCIYDDATAAGFAGNGDEGVNLGAALLYLMVGLLLVEQVFAWRVSYHPKGMPPNGARGGRT